MLPGVNKVHKISIVPRGKALGYTLNLPEEDRYLKTREELINHMIVLLGGRAAEEIVFGAVTTGASDDLNRVAEISRSMVHEYAMGTVADVAAHQRRGRRRCPTAPATCATRSSSTSPTRPCAAATRIIREHRDKLDAFAFALLRNEVLERAEIDRIMADVAGPEVEAGARPPRRRRRRVAG